MPSVSDLVKDATPRECEELQKALISGETVLWATRPQPLLWSVESIIMCVSALPGLGFMLFWTYGALGFPDSMAELAHNLNEPMCLPFLLFSIPFWAADLYLLAFPWVRRRKLRRTLYVITNRRALVMEPRLFSMNLAPFALAEGMVKERRAQLGGGGDLIFSLERRADSNGGSRTVRHGFKGLADLCEAEQKIEEALAARRSAAP